MTDHPEHRTTADAGLLTRRSTDPDQRAALRYEASLLQMLRHPGVTELIRVDEAESATELTTRSGSDHTLAEWDGTEDDAVDTAVIAGVLAALATTVADLHGLGVVHGRIEPQRVAMPESGQPVLTGFEAAGPIGSQRRDADPPLPPFCDPASPPGRPLEPATDVFGLGALLEHLLERHPSTGTDPARTARRRLRRLARSATADTPDRRPDAAALAASILDAAPAAHLPGDTTPPPSLGVESTPTRLERPSVDLSAPRARPTVRPSALAAAGAVVVVVVALLALARDRPAATSETATTSKPAGVALTTAPLAPDRATVNPDEAVAAFARPTTPSTATATPITTTTMQPSRPTAAGPTTSQPLADTAVVVFEGVRYEIGGGRRRYAVGDWNCDGGSTLATLDPSTGALTFFESWPDTGSTRAVATDRLPGAVDVRAQSVGGCHELTIVRSDRTDTYEGTGVSP
jgi:serine/threonine protein kinase